MVLRSEILVNKNVLPTQEQALPGRETPMKLPETHFVNGNPLLGPFLDDVGFAIFGLGCFWGAERKFWQRDGVVSTVVGYAGGFTPNPFETVTVYSPTLPEIMISLMIFSLGGIVLTVLWKIAIEVRVEVEGGNLSMVPPPAAE